MQLPSPPAAPSFPSCRKRRGRKGALGYGLVLPASEFGQEPMFRASFHTVVTLRASDYAPPDTGVSDLKLVAVERLPSIEGAVENLMNVTFLRGPCRGRCPHRPEGQYEFVGDHRKTSASCTGGAEPRPYRGRSFFIPPADSSLCCKGSLGLRLFLMFF